MTRGTDETDRLIGRTSEQELLAEHLQEVLAGRGGSVLIEGEPGIGKTTLLARAAREAQRLDCRLLSVAASERGQRFPLRALLDGLAAELSTDGPSPSTLSDGPREQEDEAIARPALVLVERLIEDVVRLVDDGPLVLLLDDLHWADEGTLLVWQRLARATARLPLLLVATSRRVTAHAELDVLRRGLLGNGTRLMDLAPMAPGEVADLAAVVLGATPADSLREQLEPAGGNPLYVGELLDALRRAGGIDVTGDSARIVAGHSAAPGLPPLQAIVERFSFLTPDTLDAVRMAAVLGAEFSAAELSAVTGHGPLELLGILDEATAAGVVADRGRRMRFRHAVLHQALYDSIPEVERVVLHRGAAEALVAAGGDLEGVAQQLLRTAEVTDDWTLTWIIDRAMPLAARAPDVAVDLLQRAIAYVATDDPRHAVLERRLAEAAFQLRRPECGAILRTQLARTTDPEFRAALTSSLVHGLFWEGAWDDALAVLDEAETADAAAPGVISPHWSDRFRALRALTLVSAGRYEEAGELARTVVEVAEARGDDVSEGYGRHTQACVLLRGRRTEEALAEVERCIEVTRRVPAAAGAVREGKDVMISMLVYRGVILGMLDRLEDALGALGEARAACVEHGIHGQLSGISMSRAVLYYWTGDWESSLVELDAIADLPTLEWLPVLRHGLAAVVHGHRDHGPQAEAAYGELRGRPDPEGLQRSHSSYRLMAGALLAERDGRPHEALAVLLPTLDDAYARDLDQRYQWLADIVRLALAVGLEDTARTAVVTSETEAERIPQPGRVAAAQRCRGILDRDEALLLDAAAYYAGARRTLQEGQTMEDAAVVAAAEDPARARRHLARALDRYRQIGAAWDVRRAETRLKALGVRTRQRAAARPSSGWDALTPAETKVAELVAEGFSNPRIAAELFLSPRTVQTHVSSILGKLGASSRVEIAGRSSGQRPATS
ncbi:AAA family ATPase [Streptomyces sp. NPDC048629]|uniref:helix-turn-helix transcriptional regulator n=1 Tax=Streptomyces sp. NPDC048629 TaxID=3154824 RepID=UPI00341FFCC8